MENRFEICCNQAAVLYGTDSSIFKELEEMEKTYYSIKKRLEVIAVYISKRYLEHERDAHEKLHEGRNMER